MRRSVMTRSYAWPASAARASAKLPAVSILWPARLRKMARNSRTERSSSQRRMSPRSATPVLYRGRAAAKGPSSDGAVTGAQRVREGDEGGEAAAPAAGERRRGRGYGGGGGDGRG